MKFVLGCIGKILRVILCIMLGVVIALGGIVGGGYYVLMTDGMMGKVEDAIVDSGTELPIEFTKEVRDLSVYNWGKGLIDMVGNLSATGEDATTLGKLEDYLGTTALSTAVFDYIGIDPVLTRASTLDSLAETISGNLTLEIVAEKFKIGLPDMPIFRNEEFLTTPISKAFEGLDGYSLGDFINVDESASTIVKRLASTTIKDIGTTVSTLTVGEIVPIDESTHAVIKAIANLTIDELGGEKLQESINGLTLSEVIPGFTEGETNKVLYSLKDTTIGELSGSAASNLINGMFLSEIMDISTDGENASNKTLQSLMYACIQSQYYTLREGEKLSEDEKYVYTAGGKFAFILDETNEPKTSYTEDGTRYYHVRYYQETQSYGCVTETQTSVDGEGNITSAKEPVKNSLGYYKVNYSMYIPQSSILNNKYTVGNTVFEAVEKEGTVERDANGNVHVVGVVCIDNKDVEEVRDNVLSVKNKYHAVYSENGTFLFIANASATQKGYLLLPATAVDEENINRANGTLTSFIFYKKADDKCFDMKIIKTKTVDDTAVYEFKPLEGINERMDTLTMSEVMEINEDSPKIIQKLADTKIGEMGDAIKTMPLGDMMDPGDSRLLQSLAGTTLDNMSKDINTLFIDEFIDIEEDSAQMLKAIRYAVLESQTVYLDKTTLTRSADVNTTPAFPSNRRTVSLETGYYQTSDMGNRYYYKVFDDENDVSTLNMIDQTYVLYLDSDGNEVTKTEGGKTLTLFFKTKEYDTRNFAFLDLSDVGRSTYGYKTYKEVKDLNVSANKTTLDELKEKGYNESSKNIYFTLDINDKISQIYYVFTKGGENVIVNDGGTNKTKVYTTTTNVRPLVGLNDKTEELTMGEVIEITPDSPKLLQNLADTKITKMDEKVNTMTLGDIVDSDESKLLESLADSTLNELPGAIKKLFIDEFVEINSDSAQMLQALRFSALESQLEYFEDSSLVASADLAPTVEDRAGYWAKEVDYYKNYTKIGGTTVNRYYYQVNNDKVQGVYVLYYTVLDTPQLDGSKKAYYVTREYEERENIYLGLDTVLTSSAEVQGNSAIMAIADNASIVAQEESKYRNYVLPNGTTENCYWYKVNGSSIENAYILYYNHDGNTVTNDESKVRYFVVKSVKSRPLIGLGDRTGELTIGDIYPAENISAGVLSLLPETTKLLLISTEAADKIQNSTIATLIAAKVISGDTFKPIDYEGYPTSFAGMTDEMRAFILDSTMTDVMDGMINFASDPINNTLGLETVTLTQTSYSSITAFVDSYKNKPYCALDVPASGIDVTINPAVDGAYLKTVGVNQYYVVPLFCVDTTTITGGASPIRFQIGSDGYEFRLGIYDVVGGQYSTTLSKYQGGYFYDKTGNSYLTSMRISTYGYTVVGGQIIDNANGIRVGSDY